jgi:hypothetical protein
MTDGNQTRNRLVRRSRVAAVALFALGFLVPVLGAGVGGVAAQPDCGSITYAEYPDSLGVQTVEQLQCMGRNPTADYTLRSDIDASATEDWYDGAGFEPVGTFRGTFDGNGHTVRGLTIDRPEESEVGLFSSVSSDGVIENVELERVDVTGNEVVGGLVGGTRGEVRNSSVSGTVAGEKNVGGLVGFNVGGVVTRTLSTADVTANRRNGGGLVGRNTGEVSLSYADANVRGNTALGGVVGYSVGSKADIRDTYSRSTVNADIAIVGGIAGENRVGSVLRKSYSAGELDATSEVLGVAGSNSGTVVTSYYDAESVRGRGSPGEEGIGARLTTRQMTGDNAELRMEGFDFGNTWIIPGRDSYPVLSWQTSDEPIHRQGVSDGSIGGDGGGDGEETDGETDDGNETDGGTDGDTEGGEEDGESDGGNETGDGTDGETNGEDTDGETENATAEGDTDGETGDGDADGETEDGTDGTEGMPGFGLLAGIAALLCGASLLGRRSGSD